MAYTVGWWQMTEHNDINDILKIAGLSLFEVLDVSGQHVIIARLQFIHSFCIRSTLASAAF